MEKGPLQESERAGKGGEEKAAKHVTSIVFAPSGGGRGREGEGAATAAGDRARHTYTGK